VEYIITLNNVKGSSLDDAGFRAVDLAVLREKRLNIPLSFVINNLAFEEFLKENGLKVKIEKAMQNKKPVNAYEEVLELFNEATISKDFETELYEAYESLAIDPGATASSIVSEWDYPFVTLVRSPNYLLSTEDIEGFKQNIRGKEALIKALKHVWASYYSPNSNAYRKKTNITDFNTGIIVQKMKRINESAVSYSICDLNESTILVKSFLGIQDYDFEKEILGKDRHEVDIDTLMISRAEVNTQEYSIVRNPETYELATHDLKERGSRQKLDDKQIYEIARITKRAKSFLGKNIKLFMGVRDAYTYVFFVNRHLAEPQKITTEKQEAVVGVDEQGAQVLDYKHEVTGAEALDIPKIISDEEAREEVIKEKSEEIIEQEKEEVIDEKEEVEQEPEHEVEPEVDEELKQDLEFLDEIEETKEEIEEVIEEKVEKETTLLEEVLKIKEVIERMEEHALNESKEDYDKECKKLMDMIDRVREE